MRRIPFFKIAIVSFFLLSAWSCDEGGVCECFDSAGPSSSATRSVPYFNQLYVHDNINVFLSTGSSEQVIIEGGRNLITHISTTVSGGVLSISNNNTCNWVRSYKKGIINVYITMPSLTTITSDGYGNIESVGTLMFDSLFLNNENSAGSMNLAVNSKYVNAAYSLGTANLTLTGFAKTFTADFWQGTGFIYNSNLETKYSSILTNNTGDCYVNADSALEVEIYGAGSVYYTGNPKVKYYPKGGAGQLIKN